MGFIKTTTLITMVLNLVLCSTLVKRQACIDMQAGELKVDRKAAAVANFVAS